MEHEGEFRYASWRAFERNMPVESGDWVLSFDADEFLVHESDCRVALEAAAASADAEALTAVVLPRPEIFGLSDGKFLQRVDGFWGGMQCTRLFKYFPGGRWNLRPMGCGSEPTYITKSPRFSTKNYGLSLVHLGYLRPEDVQEKYERYSSLPDHGHNEQHVASIIKKPSLVLWDGPAIQLGGSQ
jgi:hypothetical protein